MVLMLKKERKGWQGNDGKDGKEIMVRKGRTSLYQKVPRIARMQGREH